MTLTNKQQFQELVSLTQLFLLRSSRKGEWKIADKRCFEHFKKESQMKSPPQEPKKIEPKKIVKKKVEPPPPPPKRPTSSPTWSFKTKPLEKIAERDLSDMESLLQNELPELIIKKEPPSQTATTPKQNTITEVIVISSENLPIQEQLFLSNMTRAIHRCLKPATLMQEKQISPTLLDNPQLEIVITLNESPLKDHPKAFLLEPLSLYLNDPQAKASLWQNLSQKLKPST